MPCYWGENVDGTSPMGSCLMAAQSHYNPYAMIGQGYSPLSPFFPYKYQHKEREREARVKKIWGGDDREWKEGKKTEKLKKKEGRNKE
jgi:hypothetical protein